MTTTNPEVSVIIPVKNGEEYIQRIADYLIRQSFTDYEVLFVISSKSSDSSLDVANKVSKTIPNSSVLLYNDVDGLGGSKNYGMDHASGKYYWFLDVDDSPSLDYMQDMVEIAKNNSANVVACNFIYGGDMSEFKENEGSWKVNVMDGLSALRLRVTERFPVASWSMLYESKTLIDNGIRFMNGMAEDIAFTHQSLLCSNTVCYYEKPLYKYYLNPKSFCNNPVSRDARGFAEIEKYDFLEDYIADIDTSGFFRKRFTLLRMRSAGHMSYNEFQKYANGDEIISMMKRNSCVQVRFEGFVVRHLTIIYYNLERAFFRVFFYRPGRTYTRAKRVR